MLIENSTLSADNANVKNRSADTRICLPTLKGFTILKLEEIVFCEAQRNYTIFHLVNDKKVIISKTLFDYEKLLSGTVFFRIHKSFLINLLHAKEYIRGEGGVVIMSNGMDIDVSRRKKDQFLAKVKESFRY